MSEVAGINAAAGSSDTTRRIELLQDGGHQWMDPQTQVALASGQTSDASMMSAAGQFKNIMNDATQTVGSIYHDPVLQKQPSFASTLSQWVGSNVGYLPIEQPDLSAVQTQLQAKGFGVGLPTDGVWDSAWHDQFNQAHYQEQLNNQAGTGQVAPPHKVAHGFLESLMPSHAIPALWGLVKSTPGDIRSLASDISGGTVGALDATEGKILSVFSNTKHVDTSFSKNFAAQAAAGENLGNQGKAVTPQDILDHPVTRAVNDLSTLMMFLPVSKAVTPLARSLGQDVLSGTVKDVFTRSLDASAAQRGPGIIASSLNRTLSPTGGRLVGKALNNTPFLRLLYPHVMQPTLSEDGWYYATRRALAQPMRNPLINLGARTAEYTNLLGAETQGVAYADTRITGKDNQTQIARAVHNEGVISGATGTALDWVGTLGKPTLGMKPSDVVGSTIRSAEAAIHGALGDVNNVPLQWDRAMSGAPKGFDYQSLVAKHGVIPVNEWLDEMLNKEAAAMAAKARMEADVQAGGPLLESDEAAARFKELTHAAWGDPKLLGAAKAELLQNPEDMTVSFMKQRVAMLTNAADGTSNLAAYFAAKRAAFDLFAAHGDVLVHPGVWQQISKDRAGLENVNAAQDAIPLASDAAKVNPQSIVPTRSYVKQFGPPEAGRLGIAKLDTVTSQQARVVAVRLATELKQAGLDPAKALSKQGLDDVVAETELGTHLDPVDANVAVDKIRKEAFDYLRQHGTDVPTGLAVLDPAQMVARVLEFSKKLSADVSLPVDATAGMKADAANLARIGYKPVWGTDIGHHLGDPIVNPAIIRAHRQLLRKVATGLGLNTEHFSTEAPGIVAKQGTLRRWQEDQNDGKLILTAGFNAASMYKWIASQVETKPLGKVGSAAFQLFRRTNASKAQLLVDNGKAEDLSDAYHIIQNELGAANSTFATMGRKQFVQAAMAVPDEVKALNRLNGFPEDTPLITRNMAELMHRQAILAAADRPMSMMGLSKLEDVFRASAIPLGVGKVAGMNVPILSTMAAHAAVLPNDLIRARDALKFKFSPIFSARRVAKTNVKMGLQGITPTLTPLKDLMNEGATVPNDARNYLDTIYPEDAHAAAGWDATDRFLNANDLFGYSPRHFQAYSAWQLRKQGMNPTEIRKVLDKVFTYGDRTALERSVNTVWYPFSFEKSVYKLLGGYLLDNGTQRMMLQAGFSAYHAADQHVHIQDWLDKHLPVARELEKLNAFTDGVGLGQFGGINAPLLNMFLPQHNKQPVPEKVLKAAVPAWNDLSALLLSTGADGKPTLGGSVGDTAKNTYWYVSNQAATVAHALGVGSKPGLLAQHHPGETAAGQNEDGWQLRNALITGLSSVIDYNYHNPNAPQVFGDGDEVPPGLRGQKVDRTTIGQLVQRFYPLFDPAQAAPLAEAKALAAKTQIAELTARDPQRGAQFRAFQEAADKVNTYNTHGAYDTAQLAQITQDFREQAIQLSETDSEFLKFYNTNYLRLFGPIENVTG